MSKAIVAIINPGAMGISVAATIRNSGYPVLWSGAGRSPQSHERANEHGLKDVGSLAELCKRAAFLHDIGKVADELKEEGNHAVLGMKIAKRLGESDKVCNAIGAHHEDVPFESVEAVLVQVADMLSAGRPGARRETTSSYIKRIENLERIAKDHSGVSYAYAIQAGREVRVLVRPGEVDDAGSALLARDIRQKIEGEMEFPGQVKVVVIRETRTIEVAR